jgi:tRNA1(Val) A37 N6-methylase TrmN6
MPDERPDITDDAVLGGRLRLLQPRRGHRFGHDAILLAAATPGADGDRAIELGAGVGAAGLALAARVAGIRATLSDIDPNLMALAAENAVRNGLGDRVNAVVFDVVSDFAATPSSAAHLPSGSDIVLMNPPFHDAERLQASPNAARRAAHVAASGTLHQWIAAAARLLRGGGKLTMIFRADGTAALLDALSTDFGGIMLMPIHPKPGANAIRVLVGAIKGSGSLLAIRPGLVLTTESGAPTPEADAVLRHGAPLPLWQ